MQTVCAPSGRESVPGLIHVRLTREIMFFIYSTLTNSAWPNSSACIKFEDSNKNPPGLLHQPGLG